MKCGGTIVFFSVHTMETLGTHVNNILQEWLHGRESEKEIFGVTGFKQSQKYLEEIDFFCGVVCPSGERHKLLKGNFSR